MHSLVRVSIRKWDTNQFPTKGKAEVRSEPTLHTCLPVPAPPPSPAPARSCGVLQHSREPSRLPRLPRSKGRGMPGKSQASCAYWRLCCARTAPSLQGAGKRSGSPPLHRSLVIGSAPHHSVLLGGREAGLGWEGAWPKGPGESHSGLWRESLGSAL